MPTHKKIAVAGATGRVGHHVVDVLQERGYDVVAISRSNGIDIITKQGLAQALEGVDAIIDTATGPSPEEKAATDFFTTAARNLQELGKQGGAQRMVAVSIIGTDRFPGGYGAAQVAHERATLSGPIRAQVLRAAQFHEFVSQLIAWGRQGDVAYIPKMQTQLVAARAVAETLADLATNPESVPGSNKTILEIAGPRVENLAAIARLFIAKRGDNLQVQEVSDPNDPTSVLNESGGLLPGPNAILAGPTFEEWLASPL